MANMNFTRRLKKGATLFDVLDGVEAAVVDYMSKKRGLSEERFRKLLDTDTEVRASYSRKIERNMAASGLPRNQLVGR